MSYLIIFSIILGCYQNSALAFENRQFILDIAQDNFSGKGHGSSSVKPKTSTETLNTLITTLNHALMDPDFNRDFKALIKTTLGRFMILNAFDSDEQAKNLINMIESKRFQIGTSITPISGPLQEIMQMNK